MERKVFKGSLVQVAQEVSEWLGCDRDFIIQSYRRQRDGSIKDHKIPRFFEHYGQKHATLLVEKPSHDSL